jgi:hypothetical protein
MFKQTTLITWTAGTSDRAKAEALGRAQAMVRAGRSVTGDNAGAGVRGGDVVWHLHFADQAAWEAGGAEAALDVLQGDPRVAVLDSAAYAVDRFVVTAADLADGVYRTLFLRFLEGAQETSRRQLAEDLAHMRDYVPEILNWAANRVHRARGDAPAEFVWEQEFAALEDLKGPYMTSPHHWGCVDAWFDPEMPQRIVDDASLRHSASRLQTSVMADYGRPASRRAGAAHTPRPSD